MIRRFGARPTLALFIAALAVYSAVAYDRLTEPSPQFHFVDLAHSFMDGRVGTDTPTQRKSNRAQDGDPRGYREAIARTLDAGGWNDWASIRTMTLEDGTVVSGRFPWSGESGDQKYLFHTNNGEERKIDRMKDVARTCGESERARCDEVHHYVSFPPFPAVLMLPFAAVWGYDTNDVLVTLGFAALNVVLLFWLLQLLAQRGHTARATRDNVWLAIAFAFGSVAFFSSVRGEVWFTALVMGLTVHLLYVLAALDARHPLLAGLLLGLGTATRVPVAFAFVFFAWQLLFPSNRWESGRWGAILKGGALFALPILAVAGLLMAYNHARFGDPFEFGHAYLSGGAADRIRDHGMFSFHYLNGNLSAALTNFPRVTGAEPYLGITKHGLGLLVSMPFLWLLVRPAARAPLARPAWLAVAFCAVPGLLYQNSGWEQFSYRFAMDYMPYLAILLAVGMRPITGRVKGVIALAILIQLFGAVTFGRFPGLYY